MYIIGEIEQQKGIQMETNTETEVPDFNEAFRAWATFTIVLTIMVVGLYTILRWFGRQVLKAVKFLFKPLTKRFA